MALLGKFTQHPAEVGETYAQHFVAAMRFSLALLRAAFYCGVHAILPFLFKKAGSACIADLHARVVNERQPTEKDASTKAKIV